MIQLSQHHSIDPETGFMESLNYPDAFDSDTKARFLEHYKSNGLKLNSTCKAVGVKRDTVKKHIKIDPVFRAAVEEMHADWLEELESISKTTALNPKSTIERIFQLKCHLPERYGQEQKVNTPQIVINLGAVDENVSKRQHVMEAQVIKEVESGESDSMLKG